METGISDIQINKQGNVEITFCIYPNAEDFMTITVDKGTIWELHDFCQHRLSYGAELRAKGNPYRTVISRFKPRKVAK